MDNFYDIVPPEILTPAFGDKKQEDVMNICMAANDKYAPYLTVTLYSLLHSSGLEAYYDIWIMTKDITENNRKKIQLLTQNRENISIRFLNMKPFDEQLQYDVGAYYSVETIYRLMLFSKLFEQYMKMMYLDCDMVIQADVYELYHMDLEGCPLAAAEDCSFWLLQQQQMAQYVGNVPYSVMNYRKQILELSDCERYFNAGMMVLDLSRIREITDEKHALEVLQRGKFIYNDQDALNIIFNTSYKRTDVTWNYLNCYDKYRKSPKKEDVELFRNVYRERPKLVHYVSGKKPWLYAGIVDEHLFWQWVEKLTRELPDWGNYYKRPEKKQVDMKKIELLKKNAMRKKKNYPFGW